MIAEFHIFFLGTGVFRGYRGRDDLTNQVLLKINNEICYKTGDLGRFKSVTHDFEYRGRQDFKLSFEDNELN